MSGYCEVCGETICVCSDETQQYYNNMSTEYMIESLREMPDDVDGRLALAVADRLEGFLLKEQLFGARTYYGNQEADHLKSLQDHMTVHEPIPCRNEIEHKAGWLDGSNTEAVDWESEAADSRMDAIILLEFLKVAIEHLEKERGKYVLTPVYLEEAIRQLKQTVRDYDYKFTKTTTNCIA